MMQYDHIYAAICIIIELKVMFWKLYTRIYFNVGTFKKNLSNLFFVITLIGKSPFSVEINYLPNHSMYFNNFYVTRFRKLLVYITMFLDIREIIFIA